MKRLLKKTNFGITKNDYPEDEKKMYQIFHEMLQYCTIDKIPNEMFDEFSKLFKKIYD